MNRPRDTRSLRQALDALDADLHRSQTGATAVQLRQERAALVEQMRQVVDRAEQQNRNLHGEERQALDGFEARFEDLTARIDAQEESDQREAERARPLDGTARGSDRPARLAPGDTLAEHLARRSGGRPDGDSLSLDRLVRGLAGRGWRGAEREQRAVSGLTDAAGGVMLPDTISARLIDLARERSAVVRAGAVTVPMDAREVVVPRMTGDMTVEWLEELAAQTDSGPTFDGVTLKARTVRAWCLLSEEFLEDVDPDLGEGAISQAAARAIAGEMDRVALAGSGTGEEPKGLVNITGVPTVAATGAPAWADLVAGWSAVKGANYTPTGFVLSHAVEAALGLLTGSDGQFQRPPATIDGLSRHTTTTLAATGDTPVITGEWARLMLGMRSQIKVRFGEQFDAAKNAIVLKVSARMDVAVERATAFAVNEVTLP